MNVADLVPLPTSREAFRRNRERFIPSVSGCYVLTTFGLEILYLGLANNLRGRMNQHLDNPQKTESTEIGRAIFFYWLECSEIQKIERTWMNEYLRAEGVLPEFNKIFSPTST